LPCHFATREEKLSKIGDVSFDRMSTLLRQGVEGGFKNVALIEVRYVVVEFPPFMLDVLEVVDSVAESPKCVAT
jgi:hypothetical protein